MKKGVYILFIVLLAALIGISGTGFGTASQEDEGNKETAEHDQFNIENDDYPKDKKGPVPFTHRKHAYDYKILCWECHHDFDDGKNIWSPWNETLNCVDCHDPREKIDNIPNLQKAYHLNCKICHRELVKKGKKSGPHKKCAGCHQKTATPP